MVAKSYDAVVAAVALLRVGAAVALLGVLSNLTALQRFWMLWRGLRPSPTTP